MAASRRSGWWWLIGFIPLIGIIVLIILLVQDSVPHQNAYGPHPRATATWRRSRYLDDHPVSQFDFYDASRWILCFFMVERNIFKYETEHDALAQDTTTRQ
jgi:hypothetical protein